MRVDARLERPRLDAAEERPPPLGVAAVGERDDDVEALPEQRAELVLRLGEPARRERRALRVERERLPLRQRAERRRAVERELAEALLGPDLPHLVRLPHEVGRAVEREHEVVRAPRPRA